VATSLNFTTQAADFHYQAEPVVARQLPGFLKPPMASGARSTAGPRGDRPAISCLQPAAVIGGRPHRRTECTV
jgi:hypothetical protein